ncbi:MAG: helix-turn-helix domain-containing protein [Clostridiales bacterium]|nr:helix-turn-helix domain-containing protein [Clostridiales bacterium]
MEIVLLHFESYITSLATQEFYDPYGNICFSVNEELRECLRLKLIKAVLLFKI